MTSPLIAALIERYGLPLLQADDLDFFLEAGRHNLLFLPGDPVKYPEALDVAVILPELLKAFPGRIQAAIVAPESEQTVQARFGFSRWPALVLLRGADYVGVIERVRNWDEYLAEFRRLLDAAPTRAPGVGIPISAEPLSAEGCH
jgi:hydrogenase-1 operon protein HyaE